jgi:quercetin dioxygenase-like cupin family protein
MNVNELELRDGWDDDTPPMRTRVNFPLHAAAGTEASAVVYFEIEPGDHLGRHTDSAEEILFIVEGEGEAIVGDSRVALGSGTLAVVPELVPHSVWNTGDATLKVVGFFAASEVDHVFDRPVQPMGMTAMHTPMAEVPA